MDVPSIITLDGLYRYFLGTLLVITGAVALYIVAAHFGLAPSPSRFLYEVVFVSSVPSVLSLPETGRLVTEPLGGSTN